MNEAFKVRITKDYLVFCSGHFTLGRHLWRDDKQGGHGFLDLTRALGASCDVFFYILGDRLGADALAKWGQRLGLGLDVEDDIELYYNAVLTPWLNATLDLQIVDPALKKTLSPSGQLKDLNTAVVAGLRLYVRF